MAIQIALNGNRNDETVPKTTEAIVKSAIKSVKKGAKSIHFHPRDDSGKETLNPKFVDAQITELRSKLKNIPIGISTGNWIEPNLNKRLSQIESWRDLPDFVSINFDKPGFKKVSNVITCKGIKIEVGLNSLQSAKNFTESNLTGDFLIQGLAAGDYKLKIVDQVAYEDYESPLITVTLGTVNTITPIVMITAI